MSAKTFNLKAKTSYSEELFNQKSYLIRKIKLNLIIGSFMFSSMYIYAILV